MLDDDNQLELDKQKELVFKNLFWSINKKTRDSHKAGGEEPDAVHA